MQIDKTQVNVLRLALLGQSLLKQEWPIDPPGDEGFEEHFIAATLISPREIVNQLKIKEHYQLSVFMQSKFRPGVRWELRAVESYVGIKGGVSASKVIEHIGIEPEIIKEELLNNWAHILSRLIPTTTAKDKEHLIKSSVDRKVNEYSGRRNIIIPGIEGIRGVLIDQVIDKKIMHEYLYSRESDSESAKRLNPYLISLEIVDGQLCLSTDKTQSFQIDLGAWEKLWRADVRPLSVLFAHAKELGLSENVANACWETMGRVLLSPLMEKVSAQAEEAIIAHEIESGGVAKDTQRAAMKARL